MLNIKQIAQRAANDFAVSLIDDPTAWLDSASLTPERVVEHCNATALENSRSAVALALGKIIYPVARDIDAAIEEDGPLADTRAVLARYIDGMDVELSSVWAAGPGEPRIEALRELFAEFTSRINPEPLHTNALLAYMNTDARLHAPGLRKGVAAIAPAEFSAADIPAFLRTAGAPVAEESAGPIDWSDEPAPAATKTRKRKADAETSGGPAPYVAGLVTAAGITDAEMAGILGLSRSYYSLIRNGKRPWPGMKPDQVNALHSELAARQKALVAVADALHIGDIVKPSGV
ncbi:MAG: hypothetical protein IPM11_01335 [Micropruina sp.]|nr:hypothetical protein [Micropruina sp.]